MPKEKLERMKRMFEILDTPTKGDIGAFFRKLVNSLQEFKDAMLDKMARNKAEIADMIAARVPEIEAVTRDFEGKLLEIRSENAASDDNNRQYTDAKVNSLDKVAVKKSDFTKTVKELKAAIPNVDEEVTPEDVRDKLQTLTGGDRLDKSAIKGLEEIFNEGGKGGSGRPLGGASNLQLYTDGTKRGNIRFLNLIAGSGVTLSYNKTGSRHDVTISASSSALTVKAATGTVNDSNTSFTFASEPTLVVINGTAYRHGKGVTISGTSVTTDFPVGSGGDIYGL